MHALLNWFVSLVVLAGILVSWEQGPELVGHSHAHAPGHEFQPPHELPPATERHSENQSEAPLKKSTSEDFHYHALFDFSNETCTDKNRQYCVIPPGYRTYLFGTDDSLPESPSIEVVYPPLIF